jgi:hypothetical protein
VGNPRPARAVAAGLHDAFHGDHRAPRVTDLYDIQQSFDAFGRTLLPILLEIGVDVGQPEVVGPQHHPRLTASSAAR